MSSRSISRSASLKEIAGLALERRHEAEHEVLGREIEHFPARLGDARRPRGRLQDMGLAAADTGMDVERIEHHRVAAAAFGDLLRRRMRQRIGAADHEA